MAVIVKKVSFVDNLIEEYKLDDFKQCLIKQFLDPKYERYNLDDYIKNCSIEHFLNDKYHFEKKYQLYKLNLITKQSFYHQRLIHEERQRKIYYNIYHKKQYKIHCFAANILLLDEYKIYSSTEIYKSIIEYIHKNKLHYEDNSFKLNNELRFFFDNCFNFRLN